MAGGVYGRGAWMAGVCVVGGHAWQGACVAGGCVRQGVSVGRGGMHGRGHAWHTHTSVGRMTDMCKKITLPL